jgi:hypothetical protein
VDNGKVQDDGSVKTKDKDVDFEAPDIPGYDEDDLNYEWDFGDNSTSTDKDPTHKYDKNGDYDVKLKITDKDGNEVYNSDLELDVNEGYTTEVPGFGASALVLGMMLVAVVAFFRRRK